MLGEPGAEDEAEVALEEADHTVDEGGRDGDGQPFEQLEDERPHVLNTKLEGEEGDRPSRRLP